MSYVPNGGPDYRQLVARGLIPGASAIRRFGSADSVGASGWTPVWRSKAGIDQFNSGGELLEIVSSSKNDTSAGTGMRVARVEGVNTSWEAITEDVTMNGTSAVTSSNKYLWVNSCYGVSYGSSKINAGTISGVAGSSSEDAFEIPAGAGQTQQAVFAIPSGFNLEVYNVRVGSSASKPANFRFGLDSDPANYSAPFIGRRFIGQVTGVELLTSIPLGIPTIIPGGTLLWVEAQLASGTGDVTAAWDGTLYTP